MLNPLVDRFCESRRRWLIVTGVTFLAGFLTVLPMVDLYLSQREMHGNLTEELALASQAAEQLPNYAKREAIEAEILAELESRTVNAERAPEFRNALVVMVRESGCQLRRINVGPPMTRPWRAGDHPIAGTDKKAAATPFTLETRPVNLSVSGTTESVRGLLQRVQDEKMISHAKTIDLRPAGRDRRGVQMDLELRYFALTSGPQA